MKPVELCATHQRENRTEPVRCCHTCQRINVEKDIVTLAVDVLLAAGYRLSTDADTYDIEDAMVPTSDRATIIAAMMDVDDEHLLVWRVKDTERPFGWVRFVYGNDGWDVISDYTTNLEDALASVTTYAESLS